MTVMQMQVDAFQKIMYARHNVAQVHEIEGGYAIRQKRRSKPMRQDCPAPAKSSVTGRLTDWSKRRERQGSRV